MPRYLVQAQLYDIEHIYASGYSFVALRRDGAAISWGSPTDGGDSSSVQDQLKNVVKVAGSATAFAAILANGEVVSW
ncbi:unnamed protein product, partial [Symbiodinium pilosum]